MDGDNNDISGENFRTAVDFLLENSQDSIGLIGGEPTLHPEFIEFVSYIIRQGGRVRLFSNGLISSEAVIEGLRQFDKDQLSILINLNDRSSYSKKQMNILETIFNALGNKIRLGYNIFTEKFSLDFHCSTILKFNLIKGIRLGLTSPILNAGKHDYIKDLSMDKIAESIIDNVNSIEKNDILLNFDCGFFMCMFSQEQLGILAEKSQGFVSSCQPIIDIDINLDAHRCFPLTGMMKKNIKEVESFDSLVAHYNTRLEAFKIFGRNNQCLDCKFMKRNQCRGECFARILNNNKAFIEKIMQKETVTV